MPDTPAPDALDNLIDGIDYPVYVVTAASGEERAGCLVGFTTQASIDPPRMLVCISEQNRTFRVAAEAPALAIHALSQSQTDVAALFGSETGDGMDKFARCGWHPGPLSVPVLDDCARWMVGRVVERFRMGDHVGHLLEPIAGEAGDAGAVLSFQQVQGLEPGHPA